MSQPFRLGFLTHIEGAGDPRRIYEETLELFVAADQLGFDVAWIAEHHFKDLVGRMPSPFPFLAAAAQRTRHIRLGTAIVVLPFENPLRIAEDAAVVDALSGGRLELGIGSGGDPLEFEAFGIDPAQRHLLTTNGIQTLKRALRGEILGTAGQTLEPPAPTLVDRLWQSALSVVGAQHVARQGAGLLLSRSAWANGEPTDQIQLPVTEAYLEARREQPGQPRIALSRGIYPAADKKSALAALREGVMRSAQKQIQQGHFPAGLPLEYYCERLHVFYGHPDEVAEGLRGDKIFPYATDLILQYSPVIPPLDVAINFLEQIATQIAPALGWQPARH